MLLRVLITLNSLVFILVVPALEIGPSHVFNPDWPGHAKLHEVWQLATNAMLGLFAIWLVWRQSQPINASLISLAISVGFVFAVLIQGAYGGSMAHPDGSELLVLGVNPAVILLSVFSAAISGALILHIAGPRTPSQV